MFIFWSRPWSLAEVGEKFAYDDPCEIQNILPLKQTLYIDVANGPAELS